MSQAAILSIICLNLRPMMKTEHMSIVFLSVYKMKSRSYMIRTVNSKTTIIRSRPDNTKTSSNVNGICYGLIMEICILIPDFRLT